MGKRIVAVLLCVVWMMALFTIAVGAEAVDYYDSLGEGDWYGTTTDDERIDMAWDLLYIFRYAGYPVGSIPANTFAQAMNDYYDQEKSQSVWSVALTVLGIKLEEMGETRYFPQNPVETYQGMGEPDWYGSTTDDERIAMAWDLLNILRAPGHPVGLIRDNELAQSMNDYYDQDKSLSVWDVALLVVEPMMPEDGTLPMPSDYAAEDTTRFQELFEPDWYGDTTDEERIVMAWELLSVLRQSGHTIGHTSANDFAQAMNDYYDQDKSLSVWEVAAIVLEDLR